MLLPPDDFDVPAPQKTTIFSKGFERRAE